MTKREMTKFLALRTVGNFLVLFSLYGVVATFGPALYYEASFRLIQARGVKYTVSAATPAQTTAEPKQPKEAVQPGFGAVLAGSTQQTLTPPDPNFSLIIPKLGATAKIFPNVDATKEEEFLPVLQQGIAHAKGTVFPGMQGNIYLFAHSTDNWWNVGRYNAVFYLLKDLQPGDEVILFFENRRHEYVVKESVIADPTEVSYLTNAQGGEETVIMQTCYPPGTTWKRLFVKAVPKK